MDDTDLSSSSDNFSLCQKVCFWFAHEQNLQDLLGYNFFSTIFHFQFSSFAVALNDFFALKFF